MYNRFKYMDSKWNAGEALSQVIQLRGYAKANITVTPYADIYPTVKYASYVVQERGQHGQPSTLVCPLSSVNDTEIYIYSAPQLASVGDLSGLKVGFADFSMATRLQAIKIGSNASGYDNPNLTALTLGNNVLLQTLDVRKCSGLGTGDQKTVDLSGCEIIEEVYFDGTAIQGAALPNGGVLRVLHLPSTITNLTIMNQKNITDLTVGSYSNISTLRLENVPTVDSEAILRAVPTNTRVRLIGFTWECSTAAEIDGLMDILDTMRGLDESGNNMETAQVSGTIHIDSLTGDQIAEFNERYPYITIDADHTESHLYYYNFDGSQLLYDETIYDGGDGAYSATPSKTSDAQYVYTFAGWSTQKEQVGGGDPNATKGIVANRNVYAAYTTVVQKYMVRFYNGSTLLQTVDNVPYGGNATYTGTAPSKEGDWEFDGWNPSPVAIQGNTDCYAMFRYAGYISRDIINRSIVEASDNEVENIRASAFNSCSSLTSINFPAVTSIGGSAFQNCSGLISADFSLASSIGSSAFRRCFGLTSLILRKTDTICTLSNNGIANTPIASGTGYIYVPRALVDTYKAATNWSTYANRFRALEDYTVDGTITGKLDSSKI